MCKMHLHQHHLHINPHGLESHSGSEQQPQTSNLDAAFSAYSTLHFLRAYNRLVVPPADTRVQVSPPLSVHQGVPAVNLLMFSPPPTLAPLDFKVFDKSTEDEFKLTDKVSNPVSSTCPETPPPQTATTINDQIRAATAHHPLQPTASLPGPLLEKCLHDTMYLSRRQRGEKRAIPDEQKDEKYYERRKRNNEAAKKSRDARKLREDRIALRAAILEQENAVLRAQNVALRDEVATLRQMILIN